MRFVSGNDIIKRHRLNALLHKTLLMLTFAENILKNIAAIVFFEVFLPNERIKNLTKASEVLVWERRYSLHLSLHDEKRPAVRTV